MKKLLTPFLFVAGFCSMAHAQTTIYSENFNTGTAVYWTLNTTDEGSVSSTDNQWVINNSYAGGTVVIATVPATADEPAAIAGSPESYYLHILSQTGVGLGGPSNCNFDAGMPLGSYFAAMTTPISTSGYTNVYFSFWWLCDGDAACNGKVWYRTSSGGAWTQITGVNFYGTTTWANDSTHLAAFDNQPFLEFGFQFTNGNASGNDPAFAVDDISVTGVASVTAPVASFTSSGAGMTCQDSCMLFTSTSTGTVSSVSWSATGAMIESPTSDTTTICFPTAGTYSVTLTATNSGGSTSSTNVVTVNPAPSPVISDAGGTLSVSGSYLSYQWYTVAGVTPTAIAGATNSSYTYTSSGLYAVAVDSGGCVGYDTMTVIYESVPNITGHTTTFWLSETNSTDMAIHASSAPNEEIDINIYDVTGRKILTDTWAAGSSSKPLNTTFAVPGLYIIKLSNQYTSTELKWLKP